VHSPTWPHDTSAAFLKPCDFYRRPFWNLRRVTQGWEFLHARLTGRAIKIEA
jgi:hypothetical protein